MEKKFVPAPLEVLARWILDGLDTDMVMGLPRQSVAIPSARLASSFLGQHLASPVGVAAGPHTQLAHNIVAAWLCGARFIELKTVQILDDINVSRPCIDALDATFNCEWSQELTLEQSFREYLNAWVLLHLLAHKLDMPAPGVVFNMSVGYDLAGIQSEKVQRFMSRMRDASSEIAEAVDQLAGTYPALRDIEIPTQLSCLVTLSTMHGCPPAEIERIARYMLIELGIDTWVKLNPTLLGPSRLRELLNTRMGFDIPVPDSAFEHDPRFEDAMQMVRNLAGAAREHNRNFGVKLSNTLEVLNYRGVFPSNEKTMYMSGRALHPLTVKLAHLITEDLDGAVPLSFCGGADAFNVVDLVTSGLSPVTTCTDLLKPGGYARLAQYISALESAMDRSGASSLDELTAHVAQGAPADAKQAARANLTCLTDKVPNDARYHSRHAPVMTKGARPLGHFDCIAAPCQEACPAHQNVPDYMYHVARQNTAGALEVILKTNAMPAVTGRVCDHPCVERCVRNHYDAPLSIRDIKRFASESAEKYHKATAGAPQDTRVAIVGSGPAGLSAAYYLRQLGFPVRLFEAKKEAGGMVSAVIPPYRLPMAPIGQDIERIVNLGAELIFDKPIRSAATLEELRGLGFNTFVIAVGAQAGRRLEIPGEDADGVFDALEFLELARHENAPRVGPRVLVIGGGNSAMDAARSALRLVDDSGSVTVIYRRTRAEMPADHEEVTACIDEGVQFSDLLAPARVVQKSPGELELVCNLMRLGEPDASGRPRPVPIEGAEVALPCNTILVGISQEPVLDFIGDWKLTCNRDGSLRVDPETCQTSMQGVYAGGDVSRGPATIIKAVADGRRIANAIGARHGVTLSEEPQLDKHLSRGELLQKRSDRATPVLPKNVAFDRSKPLGELLSSMTPSEAVLEANRCLDCDEMCSLCVTVCPNRANQMYFTQPLRMEVPVLVSREGQLQIDSTRPFRVEQTIQIINVADFCNECGNCTPFCPTAGEPFRDKPRFFIDRSAFESSSFDCFWMSPDRTILEARKSGLTHRLERDDGSLLYRGGGIELRWDLAGNRLSTVAAIESIPDGQAADLGMFSTMAALLSAGPMIPG